jgi:hypothetical protein
MCDYCGNRPVTVRMARHTFCNHECFELWDNERRQVEIERERMAGKIYLENMISLFLICMVLFNFV